MMRFAFTCCALYALVVGDYEVAFVEAVLAVAWSISSKGWLSREWEDAKIRNAVGRDQTLFDGRRDD